MPVRSRPIPPIIPDRTLPLATGAQTSTESGGISRASTVAVMNVYDSDFEWPAGTKIASLRIIQVLPKTTNPPNQPRIGVAEQTNARAVLGTVPVEADGSAHFEAPAGKEIYFQALDQRGMAMQSMRSGTYVHPGERLTCRGCHERKTGAPLSFERTPLALRRPASKIQPDVDGANPFNFVRLVQPVLDRHCVECHQKERAVDLRGLKEGPHGWTRSYTSLAGKHGFYFHVGNGAINTGVHGGSRTIVGQFGARAAPLLRYLDDRHYGVKLSNEELHRVVLWLDCNSEFFGSYENTDLQARGEVAWPTLD